jgi:hypothetical protein
MNLEGFNKFCLVGGTALTLKYGHRISNSPSQSTQRKIQHKVHEVVSLLLKFLQGVCSYLLHITPTTAARTCNLAGDNTGECKDYFTRHETMKVFSKTL